MTTNIEETLQRINKFITLNKTERCENLQHFETVRNHILKLMKDADPTFKKFSDGTRLAGSYADNLKVSKPNEYDLEILLDMSTAEVTPDKNLPGFVHVNIKQILEDNSNSKDKIGTQIFNTLQKFVDKDGFIVLAKYQSWFEGIFAKIKMHGMQLQANERELTLSYVKTGPAHTCSVNIKDNNELNFSVDFVPALVFDESKWLANRPCPSYVKNKWSAVPKPYRGAGNTSNISFITSYVEIERKIIEDKHNLKNTLRMLKKVRDNLKISNLKSYFIKTVYLWACDEEDRKFWNNPASEVLTHMFQKLLKYLKDGNLPFYWDQKFNMLGNLSPNQINSMYGQMNAAFKNFEKLKCKDPIKTLNIFLTNEEIISMEIDELPAEVAAKCQLLSKWMCRIG